MSLLYQISSLIPEVVRPTQKRLTFKEKLKWTLIILIAFFVLSSIPLFGLSEVASSQFEQFSVILGAKFGSLLTLGIGPIVTASIVLQLLVGSKLIKIDTSTEDGRRKFQSLQKVLSLFFIIFESVVYVIMGGLTPLQPTTGYVLILIIQLAIGGFLVMLMDDVITKWGFGSGISLFILAGVSRTLFVRAFSWAPSSTGQAASGRVILLITSLISGENPQLVAICLASILSTIAVFLMAVYGQSLKVEVPLSFGSVRGYGVRWPLSFFYTSNIPVILISVLLANIKLWARMMQNWASSTGNAILNFLSLHVFGQFSANNVPISGIVKWISVPGGYDGLVGEIIKGHFTPQSVVQAILYMLVMAGGAVLFSIFWVKTAGMDARSQAKQILASGLQMPGFRRDERILERVLDRYIMPLTVMGAMAVGFLAAFADLMGALAWGTGILLSVMIAYRLYEEIAKQHIMDMNPALRKFIKQ